MQGYPLEVLRGMRERDVEAATTALALKISAADRAAQEARGASARVVEHRAHTAQVLAGEREREQAGRTLDESMRAQAWGARRARELTSVIAAAERARAVQRSADAEVDAARQGLALARAEREAVEKHHGRWDDAQALRAQRKEDNEADELASAQRER